MALLDLESVINVFMLGIKLWRTNAYGYLFIAMGDKLADYNSLKISGFWVKLAAYKKTVLLPVSSVNNLLWNLRR
jgi:hypothetical protein